MDVFNLGFRRGFASIATTLFRKGQAPVGDPRSLFTTRVSTEGSEKKGVGAWKRVTEESLV